MPKKQKYNFDKGDFIHMKAKSLFEEYEIIQKLGEGSYGCVYKVQHKQTKFIRAVKAIKKKIVDIISFENEIRILKTVDHPHIIKLFECYYDDNYFYMVEEFCSGGDLFDYIKSQKNFSEIKAANILNQILSAINYLHKKQIVHRDLKPENIVFIKTNNENKHKKKSEIFIKLIDFGTSIYINKNKNLTQELGTIYYIAPEVFKNNYNEKVDIWSIGVILFIMLCGHPPFYGKNEEDIKQKILKGPLIFPPNEFQKISHKAIDYLKKLLSYDIEKRISAEEALENKWLIKMLKNKNDENSLKIDIIKNLTTFTNKLTLQKAILSFMANQINLNEEIKILKDEFNKIDKNKDGLISKEELIHCMELLYPHEEAVKKASDIFNEIDFNNDGNINFSEFITVNMKKEKLLNADMLKNAFKIFDLDGNGYITIDELQQTIPLNVQNKTNWIEIVKEVDLDGDCQINFEAFKYMIDKLATEA
jgi:calcium-dependent protein kinase